MLLNKPFVMDLRYYYAKLKNISLVKTKEYNYDNIVTDESLKILLNEANKYIVLNN